MMILARCCSNYFNGSHVAGKWQSNRPGSNPELRRHTLRTAPMNRVELIQCRFKTCTPRIKSRKWMTGTKDKMGCKCRLKRKSIRWRRVGISKQKRWEEFVAHPRFNRRFCVCKLRFEPGLSVPVNSIAEIIVVALNLMPSQERGDISAWKVLPGRSRLSRWSEEALRYS